MIYDQFDFDINKRMANEIKALNIFRCTRCLDCEDLNSTLEFVDSPVSIDQRNMIRKLIRKNYTEAEIY